MEKGKLKDDFINELIRVNLLYFSRSDKYYQNAGITMRNKEYFERNKTQLMENIAYFKKLYKISTERNIGTESTRLYLKNSIKEWVKKINVFEKTN